MEDIEQEAVMMGIQALTKYDPSKAKLETFLYLYINSRLRDFRRNKYHRQHHICSTCKNLDPHCHTCFKRNQQALSRYNLSKPLPLDNVDPPISDTQNIEINEILSIIDLHLPIELRQDYLKMKDDIYIPKIRRKKIEQVIIDILENYCE